MRILFFFLLLGLTACQNWQTEVSTFQTSLPQNTLDYTGVPDAPIDESLLSFSDQGAWFSYSIPKNRFGFSGPFLMSHEQGMWISPILSEFDLGTLQINRDSIQFRTKVTSTAGGLKKTYIGPIFHITQELYYTTAYNAVTNVYVKNVSSDPQIIMPKWFGELFIENGIILGNEDDNVQMIYEENTVGNIVVNAPRSTSETDINESNYSIRFKKQKLKPEQSFLFSITQSFSPDPKIDVSNPPLYTDNQRRFKNFDSIQKQKEAEQQLVFANLREEWTAKEYVPLIAKCMLTLQNNYRAPAGEIQHHGFFPSYHYKWFRGFWAWDSWKHATAAALYQPEQGREQILAMYDYIDDNGFIPDCIFRDTSIEQHNYRNTKPPLSAWAVWNVYQQDPNKEFLNQLYGSLLRQHQWWYLNRDYDHDSICEFGSTDGTLIAAKWESGMDNAVRFDNSKLLKMHDGAYCLNQESVDLNAYLLAEKQYLINIANAINKPEDVKRLQAEYTSLIDRVRNQFFDEESGWFYDTSLDGKTHIKVKGCEGWTPLWANIATKEQAEAVKNTMMSPEFNTTIPFQTLTSAHPNYKPHRGYWRGPNWLDQAYFGIQGLRNYGYESEAYTAARKLIENAEGLMEYGPAIRENYNPETGAGMEAFNFSWSAAHLLIIMTNAIE